MANTFKVYADMAQGSEEWFQVRKGRATASQAKNILTSTGKPSASRIPFMWHLASECLADDPNAFQGNKYTEWGNEHEPAARDKFIEETNLEVEEVGFCVRPDGVIGCSPDGLIVLGEEYVGGLEIKCPTRNKHAEYHMKGELPGEYKMQVHWSMAATDLPFWYFMSYFPGLRPFIIKVMRDQFTDQVKASQDQFIEDYKVEYDKAINALKV